MARAAVKAKQAQAQAQAQTAAKPRGRKHASGGNPSQDLFFTRIRRRQKWVFLVLAVLFAVSFAFLGVGSGNGAGLSGIFNSVLGSGDDPVGKAQAEIKTDPAKGYKDLANAYLAKKDLNNAIGAMNNYLQIKKKDASAWTLLATWQKQQGDNYAKLWQQVLAVATIKAPGNVVQPTGKLAGIFGTNPIDQFYGQQLSPISSDYYSKSSSAYSASVTSFQSAAKYAKGRLDKAAAWYQAFTAASYAGNRTAALEALKKYVVLNPTTQGLKQIEGICKSLGGTCVPPKHKTKK
jgi:tetratricopeptide (TPR) repeat protein